MINLKKTTSVTRTSVLTGITRTMELDVTLRQLAAYQAGGLLLQDAFPHLNADEREFIKSGVTAEEWEEFFNSDEE